MEAMPPIDYAQLATKRDLEALDARLTGQLAELRGEMTGLRGEMTGLRGEMKSEQAKLLRSVFAGQLASMMMLGAWVTAVV